MKNQKVLKNSTVLLECKIISTFTEPFNFKWKKNGETIDIEGNKEKYQFIVEDGVYMLKIFKFDENDDADYEIYLSEPEDFEISSKARIELDYSLGMIYVLIFFYFDFHKKKNPYPKNLNFLSFINKKRS